MPHRNAPLTESGRLRLARCVVEDGWPVRRAAERFQVSHTTAARWARRYQQQGVAGMVDRPSPPQHSPARTPVRLERRICKLRVTNRWGPARIAARLGLAPSTVHRVLWRYHCPPLAHLDRVSGRPIRRYEHAAPGELVHVDSKKLGDIPTAAAGAPWDVPRAPTTDKPPPQAAQQQAGDRRQLAAHRPGRPLAPGYTEILPDERQETAAALWRRAQAWFEAVGSASHGS